MLFPYTPVAEKVSGKYGVADKISGLHFHLALDMDMDLWNVDITTQHKHGITAQKNWTWNITALKARKLTLDGRTVSRDF